MRDLPLLSNRNYYAAGARSTIVIVHEHGAYAGPTVVPAPVAGNGAAPGQHEYAAPPHPAGSPTDRKVRVRCAFTPKLEHFSTWSPTRLP